MSKCDHSKIPFGGHCGWKDCPNYRGRCATHKTWHEGAYTAECVPIITEVTATQKAA